MNKNSYIVGIKKKGIAFYLVMKADNEGLNIGYSLTQSDAANCKTKGEARIFGKLVIEERFQNTGQVEDVKMFFIDDYGDAIEIETITDLS